MAFVRNEWGKVYQKDLGKNTARIAGAMAIYNPDTLWAIVKDKGVLAIE